MGVLLFTEITHTLTKKSNSTYKLLEKVCISTREQLKAREKKNIPIHFIAHNNHCEGNEMRLQFIINAVSIGPGH